MKKCISIFVILMLLSFCFSFTVSAETASFTVSEDYQILCLNGNTYSRVDTSTLSVELTEMYGLQPQLSAAQQEAIKDTTFYANPEKTVISAEFRFKDGVRLTVGFLQDSCRSDYDRLISGETAEYVIDFYWPDGNTVTAQKAQLYGEAVTLDEDTLFMCDYFTVSAQNRGSHLAVLKGSLLLYDSRYYYVEFSGLEIGEQGFYPGYYSELDAYEVTDTALLEALSEAEDAYYSDFGILYDDDLTETLSAVLLVFIFAVIPAAVLVVSLIVTLRVNGYHRLVWATVSGLSAAELTIFAIIAALILMPK